MSTPPDTVKPSPEVPFPGKITLLLVILSLLLLLATMLPKEFLRSSLLRTTDFSVPFT